jgi:glutamate-5-semialdehyde dehydrogenase
VTTVASELLSKAQAARAASRHVRSLSTGAKNEAILAISDALEREVNTLLAANTLDMDAGRKTGLAAAFLARLELTAEGLKSMANGVRTVATLPDPVGEEFDAKVLANGIRLARRRVPLGVIGTIFEARPEVPADISSLCLKSGNAVILRGGSDAINTNRALGKVIRAALEGSGVPADAVQIIESTDRALVQQMVKLDAYIDLLIPRGGPDLVHFVNAEATMPSITGGIGVCHTYVDATADADMAADVIFNAKVQAPAKCNALDTVLVHPLAAPAVLPKMAAKLASANVELHCDHRALALIGPGNGLVSAATTNDWGTEFLALVLSVKVVDSMDEAIEHIETHGSGHTEAILTSDYANAMRFVDEVDAGVVLVNASTRFNDGGQFGLGAEVAISTNKLHARGPMGLQELTTYKWVALGNGQVRG